MREWIEWEVGNQPSRDRKFPPSLLSLPAHFPYQHAIGAYLSARAARKEIILGSDRGPQRGEGKEAATRRKGNGKKRAGAWGEGLEIVKNFSLFLDPFSPCSLRVWKKRSPLLFLTFSHSSLPPPTHSTVLTWPHQHSPPSSSSSSFHLPRAECG